MPDTTKEEEVAEEVVAEEVTEEEEGGEVAEEDEEGDEWPRGTLGSFASSMPNFFDMIGLLTRPRSLESLAETGEVTTKRSGDNDEVPDGSISPFLFVHD
jgi:hypothetical protein